MRTTLSAALALSLAGCGMLDAEAETNRLCVQQTAAGAEIAAAPSDDPVQITAPIPPLRLEMDDAVPDLDEEGVEVDVHPEGITLGSLNGIANLNGVATLTLTIAPPASRPELPDAVFRYERNTPPGEPIFALRATPVGAVDLADYIQGNVLNFEGEVSFDGVPPQQAWTPTLEMCGATRVEVDYWDRITG